MNFSNIAKANWPAIGVLLGLAATGVTAYLAATGQEIAMTAVGTSNFSMVLALCGTSLVIISALGWYATLEKTRSEHVNNSRPWKRIFSMWAVSAILTAVLCGLGYGVVHHVIGNLAIADNLSVSSSLITQASIGLALGAGIGVVLARAFVEGTNETVASIATIALVCACATALGPTLSACMGAAATDAASALSMEITFAAGLGLLALVPVAMLEVIEDKVYSSSSSRD